MSDQPNGSDVSDESQLSGDYLIDKFIRSRISDDWDFEFFDDNKEIIKYSQSIKASVSDIKNIDVNRYKCDAVEKGGDFEGIPRGEQYVGDSN